MNNIFIIAPLIALLIVFFIYSTRLKTFLNYRRAHPHERELLKELAMQSFGSYESLHLPIYVEVMKTNLADEANWDQILTQSIPFVCENNNTIIGMACLFSSKNPTDIFPAHTSYIRLLAVNQNYTGKGVAKKLVAECIKEARETGEKTVMLHTAEFMTAAQHIYENLGFIRVKELPERYGKKYWLYELAL
ncbi:MAG: GNAT family N-acetyltransferase [Bacteroidetes bacterium]|nr:GNAT family N-acetyltransferase [Bacteroidota bacterium]